jgi:hypothetical protein
MTRLVAIALLIATVFFAGGTASATASSLDFGWGQPVAVKPRPGKSSFLVWPIQISNRTAKKLVPQLDLVAVTDTGKQYHSQATVKVSTAASPSGETLSVAALQSTMFPSVTRQAFAVFENVDPHARVIHFYVGGLETPAAANPGQDVYLRVTYTRSKTGWVWSGTSVLE